MLSRKTFNKLSNSLKWGFFSDEIIIILSKFKKTKKLSTRDKKMLLNAKKFFNNAVKGLSTSGYKSSKSAFAFSQAVKILSPSLKTPENFVSHMKQLISITENIIELKDIKTEDINKLSNFFTDYGRYQLEITEDIMNGSGEYSRWQLIKAL